MKGLSVLLCIVVLVVTPLVMASERSSDYAKLNSILSLLKGVKSPYVSGKAQLEIKNDEIKLEDIKIWFTKDGNLLTEVNIGADATLELPVYEDAKNIKMHVNQKKDDVSISFSTQIKELEVTEIAYNDLFVLLDDINSFMEGTAGGMSFMVPTMDALKFKFASDATIDVFSANQVYRFKTNKEYEISMDVSKKLRKENPMVRFSQLPTSMSPEH
ncbi:DUF2987 domain-containing protein [Pseudoalteromonas xiamenensis]|uniref:DUF2987 domain-containing protein n=1 Tax=Pseudoalteromonas xiamenensis TaxID=882626 RepID=UPI0027E5400B|nr:DUF2987 domain-containing protein [Pseudoalteromonas xiamenensis]WMN61070.1 DUF2987 domain-containing protein [Pseudoalteromonas xiamenensis]